ncbi:MAG: LamG-like jellyroll fold domain-containing protein [Candidatus Micrarchaeia archaeon]
MKHLAKGRKAVKWQLIIAFVLFAIAAAIAAIYYYSTSSTNFNATYFNGHTYLLVNTSMQGNFTFIAWVKYTSFNGTGVIASQGISEGTHSTWYVGTGGEIMNRTMCGVFSDEKVPGNYTAGWRFATVPFIGIDSWHMIACVYNKTSISIYVNGTLENTTNTPYSVYGQRIIEIGKRTSTFYINGNTPTFAYFKGYIGNVEFYNTSLQGSTILQLYRDGINGKPMNGVSLYIPLSGTTNTTQCLEYGRACNASLVTSK